MRTVEIVEFLRARLAEDEAIARNALGLLGIETPWHNIETLRQRGLTRADARHVNRHSSRRVLREVEAKRRVIDLADSLVIQPHEHEEIMRTLTSVYANHPDYDPEWA